MLPIGRGDASHLDALVDAYAPAGGWAAHPALYVVAVDLVNGERVAFGKTRGVGSYAIRPALRDALRASWAVPGWFPPVTIDGREWTDGGVASPTSADLLVDEQVDEVVIVAPMASTNPGPRAGLGRIEQFLRSAMTRRLDAEVALLERAGVAVLRVEPGADDLAVMGPNFMAAEKRLAVLESSLRTTRHTVASARARSAASFGKTPAVQGGAA
jgi:NTE family protein